MSNLVFVRVRPLKAQGEQACLSTSSDTKGVVLQGSNGIKSPENFKFDGVFGMTATQEDVFQGVKNIVHAVLEEGYNGTIMAYGQTSAGKTHAMFGGSGVEQRGIVPRVAELAIAIASSSSSTTSTASSGATNIAGDCTFTLSASVIEIYNEQVRCLLNPTQDNLPVFENAQGVHVPGMKTVPVRNEGDLMEIVEKGMNARSVGATHMNQESSRSHCLVILAVEKVWKDGRKQRSKLCLVDLAGSERHSKTGAQGITLQEGLNINKSLLVLGSVVNALNDGTTTTTTAAKTRVPYRDSKLTRLLQDSLGGTAKTCILVCCSPAVANYAESLSSLRFGARARAIQSNAVVNAITPGAAAASSHHSTMGLVAAQQEICALKRKLEEAEGKVTAAGVGKIMSSDRRRASLRAAVWAIAGVAQATGVLLFFAVDYACASCNKV